MALSIVAIALVAGLQSMTALTHNALRQSDAMLAQLCAENALVQLRLSRQLPALGDSTKVCEQAGRALQLTVSVQPTPNPLFRRVDARVGDGNQQFVQISTVMTRD